MKRMVMAVMVGVLGGGMFCAAKPAIEFRECYVNYDPRNGETELIFYAYTAADGVALTTNGVAAALGLKSFSVREVMFSQGDGPKALRILAGTDRFLMNSTVEELFGALLGRPVRVVLEKEAPPQMHMLLFLPDAEGFYVADNNADGQMKNEALQQILLKFDVARKPISVVLGFEEPETVAEKMDRGYQHDADIFRLRHLKYYAGLIREFHEKTGRYPLQGKATCPNYVHLAAPHQEQYVEGAPPYEHVVTPVEVFRAELEKGLGREVDLRFDPQKVPVAAPNFYIYMVSDDYYFLAVHLYSARPFAQRIGKHYYKVHISSKPTGGAGLWNADDLMKDAAFRAALNEKPEKGAFFQALEKRYH